LRKGFQNPVNFKRKILITVPVRQIVYISKARTAKTIELVLTAKIPAPDLGVVDGVVDVVGVGEEPVELTLPDNVKLTVVIAEIILDGMGPVMLVGAVPFTRNMVKAEG